MPSKRNACSIILVIAGFAVATFQLARAAELNTLFTSPQERQTIDSNRYKGDEAAVRPQPVVVEDVVEQPIQQQERAQVTRQYVISGIALSNDGPPTVWINSLPYEDGEQLDDNSKIKVLAGDEIQVRITAPDGKNHYATSGQTIDVTYLEPLRN